ncbi:MAG: glycosyltransferase family 4 protein [Acidobacteriota bacterium]
MRICHVTSHLPPDQAANALLPHHLGTWSREAGHEVCFIAHPPRMLGAVPRSEVTGHAASLAGAVVWVPPRPRFRVLDRVLPLSAISGARIVSRLAAPVIAKSDIVHIHSNGLLPEWCAYLAARAGRPVVLTLYGTEIWHYRRRWFRPDLFTRIYRQADRVTFYSQALLGRAVSRGLAREGLSVIYPPVAGYFEPASPERRRRARSSLGVVERFVLLNVKRLHPLAGQRDLLAAMPTVLRRHPDTRLFVCGAGPLRDQLEQLARQLGISSQVTFTGLVDNTRVSSYYEAADLFILPSLLEALPTVAVEALATGTPVVSTDSPGGTELSGLFGPDVVVVPTRRPEALAASIVQFLEAPRRTLPASFQVLTRLFKGPTVYGRYHDLYGDVLAAPT